MIQKIKYAVIIVVSTITNQTVLDIFGGTYVVAGNFVKRIR